MIPSLIALHTLPGCDSVPTMFGIAKGKALKAAKELILQHVGNEDANIDDVIMESKRFVAKCYGENNLNSSSNRLTNILIKYYTCFLVPVENQRGL